MFDLNGKIAVVTGGASGIGKAITLLFTKQNAFVHLLEFNQEQAEKTVQEIQEKGGGIKFQQCDVSKQDEVNTVINEIGKNHSIDILINNAGIAHIGNIEMTKEEELDRVFNVNVKGIYNCTRAVIPFMKKNGGTIINMASVAGIVGVSDRFAYSMSKGAALSMTYSVAKDYLEFGIRCNSISPARVHTPFVEGFIEKNYPGKEKEMFDKLSKTQPIGRMGKTEEVAALALYLSSDEASFITGANFPIDGGFIKLNG